MFSFDVRDPLSWTGFAFGIALSLSVIALATPAPVPSHNGLPCHAITR